MIWGLLEKELRQHLVSLLVFGVLILGGLEVVLHLQFLNRALGTPLASLRLVLWSFVPVSGMVLGQALIASEYRHNTQLFLEGLPLPRWVMVTLKYLLGFLVLETATAALLAMAVYRSHGADAFTPRFLCLLALRAGGLVWFLWSLCFAHGFVGRYRLLFGVAAVVAIKLRLVFFGLDIGMFGPSELVGDGFAFDRHDLPYAPLAGTAAYAVLWTALGFTLGLARDATLAAALFKPMSRTEKFSIFLLSISSLVPVVLKPQSEPVHLPGSIDAVRGAAQVSAASTRHPSGKQDQQALEQYIALVAEDLRAVAEFLRIEKMPPVFIVHRPDLKAGIFVDAELPYEQGLMVRANLTDPEFRPAPFLAWILRETLLAKSLGRLELDQNVWVLDGFVQWWPSRNSTPDRVRSAFEALPEDFSIKHVEEWNALRDDAGNDGAGALAAMGLQLLKDRHGEEACRRFLSSVLATNVSRDVRPYLRDVFYPVSARFHRATRESLESFTAAWKASIQEDAARLNLETKP